MVVGVRLTEEGRRLLWDEEKGHAEEEEEEEEGLVKVRYAGGPLLALPEEDLWQEDDNERKEGLVQIEEEEEQNEEEIPAWVLALSLNGAYGAVPVAPPPEGLEPESLAEQEEPAGQEEPARAEDLELPGVELSPFESLAFFASYSQREYEGLLGATAIAKATYGEGTVLCISPHPEMSRTEEELSRGGEARLMRLVQRAVRAAHRHRPHK